MKKKLDCEGARDISIFKNLCIAHLVQVASWLTCLDAGTKQAFQHHTSVYITTIGEREEKSRIVPLTGKGKFLFLPSTLSNSSLDSNSFQRQIKILQKAFSTHPKWPRNSFAHIFFPPAKGNALEQSIS